MEHLQNQEGEQKKEEEEELFSFTSFKRKREEEEEETGKEKTNETIDEEKESDDAATITRYVHPNKRRKEERPNKKRKIVVTSNIFLKIMQSNSNDELGIIENFLDPPSQISLSRTCTVFKNRMTERIFKTKSDEMDRFKTNQKMWFPYNCVLYGHGALLEWFVGYCNFSFDDIVGCKQCKVPLKRYWEELTILACVVRPSSSEVVRALMKCAPESKFKIPKKAWQRVTYGNDDADFIFWMFEKCIKNKWAETIRENASLFLTKSIEGGGRNRSLRMLKEIADRRKEYTFSLRLVLESLISNGRYEDLVQLLCGNATTSKSPALEYYEGDETYKSLLHAVSKNTKNARTLFMCKSARSGDLRTFVFCLSLHYMMWDSDTLFAMLKSHEDEFLAEIEMFPFLSHAIGAGYLDILKLGLECDTINWTDDLELTVPFNAAKRVILNNIKMGVRFTNDESDIENINLKDICGAFGKVLKRLIDASNASTCQWIMNRVEVATSNKKFEVIRMLHNHGLELNKYCDETRCEHNGRFGTANHALHRRFPMWDWIKYMAAHEGDLLFLQWMNSKRALTKNDPFFLSWAVSSGDVRLLDWAVEQGIVTIPHPIHKDFITDNDVPIYDNEGGKLIAIGASKSAASNYDSPFYTEQCGNDELLTEVGRHVSKNPYTAVLDNGFSSRVPREEKDVRSVEIFDWLKNNQFRLNGFYGWTECVVNHMNIVLTPIGAVALTESSTLGADRISRGELWKSFLWFMQNGKDIVSVDDAAKILKSCNHPLVVDVLKKTLGLNDNDAKVKKGTQKSINPYYHRCSEVNIICGRIQERVHDQEHFFPLYFRW